jgi:hypothetical protein
VLGRVKRDESLAGDLAHRSQQPPIMNAARLQVFAHHVLSGIAYFRGVRGHVALRLPGELTR